MLAGATASTLVGDQLTFRAERSCDRLVLFTPPTDFFRRPGALALVKIPMQVWAGGKDTITPPVQASFLKDALADQAHVEIIVVEDAGHFTFMDELPPHVTDAHPDRGAFLQLLGEESGRFLAA
jgi:pimeloyl-ACP methyl ester carboxylesterase